MDGINAYIVVAPSFTSYFFRLVKQIVDIARQNQAQVIIPLDTFEVMYESKNDELDVLEDELKRLFPDSGGELPQGQPVVRLQQKHEGVYDNGDIRPLLHTVEGYSLAFLMYAKKNFGKKLIFVTKSDYKRLEFVKRLRDDALDVFALYGFARYGIELCNNTKLCNPYYIRDLILGKPRQYTVPWPFLIDNADVRLDYTLYYLIAFLAYDRTLDIGLNGLYDHYILEDCPNYKVIMLEHREKFEKMLGKSLFDEFTCPGGKPLSMHGKVLSILCRNDERYQDLIEYCEQPSELDSD